MAYTSIHPYPRRFRNPSQRSEVFRYSIDEVMILSGATYRPETADANATLTTLWVPLTENGNPFNNCRVWVVSRPYKSRFWGTLCYQTDVYFIHADGRFEPFDHKLWAPTAKFARAHPDESVTLQGY